MDPGATIGSSCSLIYSYSTLSNSCAFAPERPFILPTHCQRSVSLKPSFQGWVIRQIFPLMKLYFFLIALCLTSGANAQSSFFKPAFFRGVAGTEAIFIQNSEVPAYRGFGTSTAGGVSFNLPYLSTTLVLGVGTGTFKHRSPYDVYQIRGDIQGRYTYLFGELGIYGTTNQFKHFSALVGAKCRNGIAAGEGVHEIGLLAIGPSAGVQYRWARRTRVRLAYTYLISPSIMRGQQVSLSLEF